MRNNVSSPDQSGSEIVDTARYIAEMAHELSILANKSELHLIVYFLKLAEIEANSYISGERGITAERARPPGSPDHPGYRD